jgi:hypothetical protein
MVIADRHTECKDHSKKEKTQTPRQQLQRCWSHLGIGWRMDLPFHAMMEEAKSQTNHSFFMEFLIMAA